MSTTASATQATKESKPVRTRKRWPIWDWLSAVFDSEFAEQASPREPRHPLDPGLGKLELAAFLRRRLYEDKEYARSRRRVWSARATLLRVTLFALSGLATIFLGLADLKGFALVGFILSALVTTVSGLEGFFNWRSRWIASELALARWHDIEESLALYVASRKPSRIKKAQLMQFDDQRRDAWSELSATWISQRKG